MSAHLITRQDDFDAFCERLAAAPVIAFDTEFVSEFTYRPRLCLLQFATKEEQVAVDPFTVPDLSAWWDIMANEKTRIVVHGGREEVLFCWHATGKPPGNLVDVQIVQGLLSRGFPLSHAALVQKVLRKKVQGKETRTDWGHRPLSQRQIVYAIEDVLHLITISEKQQQLLKKTGRLSWAEQECQQFVDGLILSQRQRGDAWLKLPKIARLQKRELAVARALFQWREKLAEQLDKPVRSLLRDDLLIDLAHRRPSNQAELLSTRDMQRSNYRRSIPEMLEVIEAAGKLPDAECPILPDGGADQSRQEEHVLGKLLAIALANFCAELDLSPALLATANDLRDFVRWYQEGKSQTPPKLASGWRYEICGQTLEDLLDGKVSLRVADPLSEHPLVFERNDSRSK